MAWPLIAGAALKLTQGFLKGRAEKKRAKAQRKAQEGLFSARKGAYEAGQARRGSKLDAIQALIGNQAAVAPAGTPSYAFNPEVLERMKAAIPFAETIESQQVGGDPRAGMGSAMLSGFAGGLGDTLLSYGLSKPGGGIEGGVPAGVVPQSMDNPDLVKPLDWRQ